MAISVRTLKRRLNEYGLRKGDQAASDHVVPHALPPSAFWLPTVFFADLTIILRFQK